MSILITIFLIIYLILAKIRLDLAIMFLIVALPTYLIRFTVLGIPFTLLEAMILISFLMWFLKDHKIIFGNIKYKLKIKNWKLKISNRYPFDVEIILLLLISYIAMAIAGFSDSAMGVWKAYFFEPVLLFIVILNVFRGKDGINKILWTLSISALAVSLVAIFQKFTGAWIYNELWAAAETRRVTSFFGYPNAVGLYLGPIIMILIGWLINELKVKSEKLKVIFITCVIIFSLISIYFAKSEGALVAVAAGLIGFGLLAGKRARWATLWLIIIVIGAIMMSQPTRDYAIKKITLRDLSGEIRKQQWRETWQMLEEGRILTGAGLAKYQAVIKPYHQEGIFFNRDDDPDFHRRVVFDMEYHKAHWQPVEIYLYPHNILLNFWTELGLLGALLFLWIIIKYFYIGIRNCLPASTRLWQAGKLEIRNSDSNKSKYLALGFICSMIVIVVHGVVDVPYFKNDLAVMFWIFVAMISLLNLTKFKNQTE